MNTPRVGVAVIIIRDKRLLLIKRKGAHGAGSWAVPGGHLEFGENLEDCAAREVLEEVGMRIGNARFAGITNDIFPNEGLHYITIWMTAGSIAGKPAIASADEVEDWGWFTLDALPAPLFLPLEMLVKGRSYPQDIWKNLVE